MKHLILTIFLAAAVISCRNSESLEEYYSESGLSALRYAGSPLTF